MPFFKGLPKRLIVVCLVVVDLLFKGNIFTGIKSVFRFVFCSKAKKDILSTADLTDCLSCFWGMKKCSKNGIYWPESGRKIRTRKHTTLVLFNRYSAKFLRFFDPNQGCFSRSWNDSWSRRVFLNENSVCSRWNRLDRSGDTAAYRYSPKRTPRSVSMPCFDS